MARAAPTVKPPRHHRSALLVHRSGFTLIELLTVIAIIGVLATLLASALASAKTKSQRTVCLGNLHQISVAVNLYSDDTGRRPRSMTRLTQKPSWLASARSLLCPADPVLLRPRGPKGETNQAWGNRANGSQELYSYDKNPEAGSFQAELAEKTETVQFSYLHPLGWAKPAWQKLASQGSQAGVSVCQIHGVRVPSRNASSEHRMYMDYEGSTFRAQHDGAVVKRKIFRSGPATEKDPEYPWEFYTDTVPVEQGRL